MPTSHIPSRGWRRVASTAKRLAVITVGFMLCGAGLIMLVVPGPGILVIFLGLLILATEYSWADRALERTRGRATDATSRLHASRIARLGVAASATALITGGAAAAVIADGNRYLGISAVVAGIGALAILIPATQRLIDRPTRPPTKPNPSSSPSTTRTSPANWPHPVIRKDPS